MDLKQNRLSVDHKLTFLETLRGLAALYVVIHHARWLLWIGYSNGYLKNPDQFSLLNKMLVYFFSLFIYGHEMVLFFFVLSGFVIHLRYSKNLKSGEKGFQLQAYLIRRFKRIFPPLVFAITLTFILDSVGKYYSYPIYSKDTPFRIVKDNFDLSTLLGNLSFLMNTYVETWGSNFALWSLKFEWWFYMIYPVLFLFLRRSTYLAFLLVTSLYVLSFYTQYWPSKLANEICGYLLTWWFGVYLADVYTKRVCVTFSQILPFSILIPLMIIVRPDLSQQTRDTLWGLGFSGVLAGLFYLNERKLLPVFFDKVSGLGRFSFSLYITHVPILVLISGWLLDKGELPLSFEYVLGGTAICIGFAIIVHSWIETPFLSKK